MDNTFIVEDIVQRLRAEKERRQFMITTHNANIPILGDAELICAHPNRLIMKAHIYRMAIMNLLMITMLKQKWKQH